MRASVSVAVTVALAFVGRSAMAADRVAQVKAMLDAQAHALMKGDDDAFKATLADGASVSLGGGAPSGDDLATWSASLIVSQVVVVDSHVGWSGTWGWVAAELRVSSVLIAEAVEARGKPSPHTLHWLAVVVPDGNVVKSKVIQAMWTKPDRELTAVNDVQKLVPRASPSTLVALLAKPDAVAHLLANDPAVTVFGSSPDDRAYGSAPAKTLLGAWAKLAFEVVDTLNPHDTSLYMPVEVAMGDVTIVWARTRMKLRNQPKWVLLDTFAIARATANGAELVAISYGPD